MSSSVIHFQARRATESDAPLLSRMNHQLIADEGHRNPMSVAQLEQRMRGWLAGNYAATLFEIETEVIAYALYQETDEKVYLRQFFVHRFFRRQGHGQRAIRLLRTQVWPLHKRLTVDVLWSNREGVAFWKAVGFHEYGLTMEILPSLS